MLPHFFSIVLLIIIIAGFTRGFWFGIKVIATMAGLFIGGCILLMMLAH